MTLKDAQEGAFNIKKNDYNPSSKITTFKDLCSKWEKLYLSHLSKF
jgi:hypothetical protein